MDRLNFFSLFSYNLFPASVHSLFISALFYLYRSYSAVPQVGIISLTSPEDPQLLLQSRGGGCQWQSLPVLFVGPTLTPRSVSAMLCGATSGVLGTRENLVHLTTMTWGSQGSSTLPNWQLEARWDTPGI